MAHHLTNPNTEAERLVKESGDWIVATVESRISWPTRLQTAMYHGKKFILFPKVGDGSPAIALRADLYGIEAEEARKYIMRFCSALCWAEGAGIEVVAWGGGSLPRPVRLIRSALVAEYLYTDNLPNPADAEARAALALYREGVSISNPFYSFLSLYKSMSIAIPNGRDRGSWINSAIASLDDFRAIKRRDHLSSNGVDISQYIRDEGRNAIAHAERQPYVNPDEVEDLVRLHEDVPLMKNLAELAIEQHMGILRSVTTYRKHQYEVDGFKKLFLSDIVKSIQNSEELSSNTIVNLLGNCCVIARRGAEVHAFQNIYVEYVGQVEGGIVLECVSKDDAFRIRIVLDFVNDKLLFNPVQGIGFVPNRRNRRSILYEISLLEFQRCILTNGRLEVWKQDEDLMLGRTDAYIPQNCFVNHEHFDAELEALQNLLGSVE